MNINRASSFNILQNRVCRNKQNFNSNKLKSSVFSDRSLLFK